MTTRTKDDSRLRAAVCARVSTSTQVKGTSLETQVDECAAYAASRGWQVVGTYVDGGVSGKHASRPGLDRLMADCRAGLVDAVIVSKHDRFGRSFRHTVTLIGELGDLGVEFVSLAEHIDDTPAGRFQRNMLLSVAEFERERILERTVAGMDATARAGRWPVGTAPFGWRVVKDPAGHPSVEVHPGESKVWERVVTCLLERRLSTLETARDLNEAGMRRRGGKPWSAYAVWRMVRDTACLSGTWTYRRSDHRQRRNPLGEPIEIAVPPLLTPERHEALRATVEARSWSRKQTRHDWLLSGLIASPHGRAMWGKVSARGVRNYTCPANIAADGGGGGNCGCRPVHADDLEAAVWGAVRQALATPELLVALAEHQASAVEHASDSQAEDLAALDRRISRLEAAAGERLAQALAAGVDPKVAAAASASLGGEIEQLRRRRAVAASWAVDAQTRRSRVELVAELAERSSAALAAPDAVAARRRILDVLDVRVAVTGWAACDACGGSGKRTGGHVGESCEDCHGMRQRAAVELTGVLPAATGAASVGADTPLPVRFALGA